MLERQRFLSNRLCVVCGEPKEPGRECLYSCDACGRAWEDFDQAMASRERSEFDDLMIDHGGEG